MRKFWRFWLLDIFLSKRPAAATSLGASLLKTTSDHRAI
jgi:hypothetical protein